MIREPDGEDGFGVALTRRGALKHVTRAVLAAALAPLVSCRGEADPSAATAPPAADNEVLLSQLEGVSRLVVTVRGEPIEIVRAADGFVARSFLCPHFGCRLAWREESGRYECPCHLGMFDREGRVISGPSTLPMRRVPVRVARDRIVLG
jgi:cytochrome b6-f complex iron-sulfur subunit